MASANKTKTTTILLTYWFSM